MTQPAAKPMTTREKLLHHARRLLWARGYSNVSVRQIAAAAGVDVALISRYYGSKLGLFEVTLENAFDDPSAHANTPEQVMDMMTHLFVHTPRCGDMPSIVQMILTNAQDDDVGEMVRGLTHRHFHAPLLRILGSPQRTALFMSVLMGISVVEKTIRLPGYPAPHSSDYAAMLRHMMQAALSYKGPEK